MSRFNNVPNERIIDTKGREHWISPSFSVDGLIVVNGFVLIVKRSDEMSNAGRWCLPCGFMDWNETPSQACIREVYEETGIDVRGHNIINKDSLRPHAINGVALQFVFEMLERPKTTLDTDECVDYAWVSTSMLNDYEFAFGHDRLIEYFLNLD